MSRLISAKNLHRLFEAGVGLKGLDGVLEIIGGLSLYFTSPAGIMRLFDFLTRHELVEDPHDFLVTHAAAFLSKLTPSSTHFGAIYLLLHGATKVFLAVSLLQRKLWAYPLGIIFLVLFLIYQLYRYSYTHSIFLLLLSAFDSAIILLIWNEYRYLEKHARPGR